MYAFILKALLKKERRIMKGERWVLLAVGIFFASQPIILLWGQVRYHQALGTLNWPMAPGRILQSDVKDESVTDFLQHRSERWVSELQYQYTVNGHEYLGNRINVLSGDLFSHIFSRGTPKYVAVSAIQPYPLNAAVTIFYDPSAPEKSLLQPGPTEVQRDFQKDLLPLFVIWNLLVVVVLLPQIWKLLRD